MRLEEDERTAKRGGKVSIQCVINHTTKIIYENSIGSVPDAPFNGNEIKTFSQTSSINNFQYTYILCFE